MRSIPMRPVEGGFQVHTELLNKQDDRSKKGLMMGYVCRLRETPLAVICNSV